MRICRRIRRLDLAPIVQQVADGLQTLARDRDVDDQGHRAVRTFSVVLGDRDELIRALENLVENALKYGAAGKRVDITLREQPDPRRSARGAAGGSRLRAGHCARHLPRLTERFYRVDVADSRAQGGTGLGLALVKHVLNRHGGRLSIESTPGEGATFIMHLPLHTGDSVQARELS